MAAQVWAGKEEIKHGRSNSPRTSLLGGDSADCTRGAFRLESNVKRFAAHKRHGVTALIEALNRGRLDFFGSHTDGHIHQQAFR